MVKLGPHRAHPVPDKVAHSTDLTGLDHDTATTFTRRDLLELHARMAQQALALLSAKSQDYARYDDPFINLRMAAELSGVGIERVALQYLAQKLVRLRNVCDNGAVAVKGELVEDTLMDIINYSVLLAGILEHKEHEKQKDTTSEAGRAV